MEFALGFAEMHFATFCYFQKPALCDFLFLFDFLFFFRNLHFATCGYGFPEWSGLHQRRTSKHEMTNADIPGRTFLWGDSNKGISCDWGLLHLLVFVSLNFEISNRVSGRKELNPRNVWWFFIADKQHSGFKSWLCIHDRNGWEPRTVCLNGSLGIWVFSEGRHSQTRQCASYRRKAAGVSRKDGGSRPGRHSLSTWTSILVELSVYGRLNQGCCRNSQISVGQSMVLRPWPWGYVLDRGKLCWLWQNWKKHRFLVILERFGESSE